MTRSVGLCVGDLTNKSRKKSCWGVSANLSWPQLSEDSLLVQMSVVAWGLSVGGFVTCTVGTGVGGGVNEATVGALVL